MVSPLSAVPVSILTGFLGAGKTTLLNRLLKDPDLSDTAVIINEFGDVSIDHLLVEASSDGVIELSDGCLCCTVRGELVDTLADLMDRMQTGKIRPLKRVVIETTGLADPAPVLQSVIGNPIIAQNFRLDGVVTVVDAVNGLQTIANHEEALKQIAVADRIVISKTGLAETSERDALTARIRALNPRAPLIDGDSAEAGRAELFDCGLYDPSSKIADVGRWLQDEAHHDHHHHDHGHDHHDHDHHHDHGHDHHHHHDVTRHGGDIRSFSIVHDRPIEPMALDMFIDLLRSAHGEKLLRMKAIVAVADRPDRPLVLHGVQNVFHTPERLAAWPDPNDRRTRMVLITKGLEEAFVRDLFDAFTGKPRIDRPDAQALSDNPLAVPGMRF
ncbi:MULTISPECIES: CobW family GTP-binding protein [Ensifer]|uniref:CobW family GTP-binding protein n=1 Tax=Ensifer TaxID=106591 RepID=UPI0007142353|nr:MULTISPECIES: GTP-binding protein [Ensifer]KQX55533.1 ATP-binding protein [Ensifer sp. Root1298]KQX91026.1 ATP-binding protein [Ensifer sp. Root1312]KRC25870.1 ATP-binding protein [Ensifer sp. Root74]KRD73752.1 ATP-binding protein [Ensifer sp. Root954]UTV35785.1 GTP-binding protein [Ensifer adhaerens]